MRTIKRDRFRDELSQLSPAKLVSLQIHGLRQQQLRRGVVDKFIERTGAGRASQENELEQIQGKIGTPEYWSSEPMQARYRELLRLTGQAD